MSNVIHEELLDSSKQELAKIVRQFIEFGFQTGKNEVVWANKRGEKLAFYPDGGFTFLDSKIIREYRSKIASLEDQLEVYKRECKDNYKKLMDLEREVIGYRSERIEGCENTEKEVLRSADIPKNIDLAKGIIEQLETMYKDNGIDAFDNDCELFDNDIRRIAQHLLVEIGDI